MQLCCGTLYMQQYKQSNLTDARKTYRNKIVYTTAFLNVKPGVRKT